MSGKADILVISPHCDDEMFGCGGTILKKIAGVWTQTFSSGTAKLYAVPSNVGPRTMPSYAALARQGIYDLGNGVRVFAGTLACTAK